MEEKPLKTPRPYKSIKLDVGLKGAPQYLSQKIQEGMAAHVGNFLLGVKQGSHGFYPNTCVPLTGIIDYYRREFDCTFSGDQSWENSPYLSNAGIITPWKYDPSHVPPSFLDKVWEFNKDTHFEIVSGILSSLRRAEVFGENVLLGIELALNEITDNILQHSVPEPDESSAIGFAMAQYHYKEHKIAVAVFDSGQGIPASLAMGGNMITTANEALEVSLRRGVTDGKGAGNGLWMMTQIVLESEGSFDLSSDGAKYSVRHMNEGAPRAVSSKVNKIKTGTTLVDFQLSTAKPLNLEKAIGGDSTNLWLESHLGDSADTLIVYVKEESRGTGSRVEAKAFSNVVLNLIENSKEKCVLDFTDIPIVSASFADQLLCDVIDSIGFIGFMHRIQFDKLSKSCALIFNECFRNRFFKQDSAE